MSFNVYWNKNWFPLKFERESYKTFYPHWNVIACLSTLEIIMDGIAFPLKGSTAQLFKTKALLSFQTSR
jgi:hypothetical protein